jgi:DnaJ family protein C protein 10
MHVIYRLFICSIFLPLVIATNEEFYQLLGITKSATQRDIRRAFKRIALEKHPDKRAGDPNAHAEFLRINRAYEILRDDELRKKYDTYGEEGLKDDFNRGNQYQSWNFYQHNFGIYDEDPEIITLSRADFLQSVDGSQDVWFINFYSPQCSHCHDLAPAWREISKILEGVIRIGAINCQDEWMMCNEQGIQAYPTLRIYPKRDTYQGPREKDALIRYAMSFVSANVIKLDDRMFKNLKIENNKPWLVSFCRDIDEGECLDDDQVYKLAVMLNNLVQVSSVNCHADPNVCQQLKPQSSILFYQSEQFPINDSYSITTLNLQEIVAQILGLLPDLSLITDDHFNKLRTHLKQSTIAKPWLIHFVDQTDNGKDLDLRKLPSMLTDFNVGRFDCSLSPNVCTDLYIFKRPAFVLFKRDDYYEFYYGRHTSNDIAGFVRDNAYSPLRALTPTDFPSVTTDSKPFIIDFFSPFCPPCMHLLPEFRKTSKRLNDKVNFGTVDCTIHNQLCQQIGINSYPTTIMYNQSIQHYFNGQHQEQAIINFIDDILNPTVISLDNDLYIKFIENKNSSEMWLVDFFMPWCFPCQQLSGEWRMLSKYLKGIANVAQIDCSVQTHLCQRQGVYSYPTIRLYPPNSDGQSFILYNNGWRDANSLRAWAFQYLPSKVIELDEKNFSNNVLRDSKPWIIDFYAPWCGHCHHFSPIFESIAQRLNGKVNLGKINCDNHRQICERASIRAYPTVKYYKGSIDSKRQVRFESFY